VDKLNTFQFKDTYLQMFHLDISETFCMSYAIYVVVYFDIGYKIIITNLFKIKVSYRFTILLNSKKEFSLYMKHSGLCK
jgi:hypothetical protein